MTFQRDILRFTALVRERQIAVHKGVARELRTSVVDGSEVTGAPGQPVQSSNLKTSWQPSFPEKLLWQLITNVIYAPGIEDAVGPHGEIQLRSEVGGFHSVKITVANYHTVVAMVMREVVG